MIQLGTMIQGYNFVGSLNENLIQPLCIIFPQMNGSIKYFENNAKNVVYDRRKMFIQSMQKFGIKFKNF